MKRGAGSHLVQGTLAVLSVALFASTSLGGTTTTLLGAQGKVNVQEFIPDSGFFVTISYAVDVLDDSSVYAFAVSNGGGVAPEAFSTRSGWSASVLNSAEWNAGVDVEGMSGVVSFNTKDAGAYSTFFGDDPLATMYWLDLSTGIPVDENSDELFEFKFNPNGESDFVAFAANGAILDSSRIPEPASCTSLVFSVTALYLCKKRSR